MLAILRPVWIYRGFVLGSVKREFQSRYRNSLLGAAWIFFQPLAQILVYTIVFSQIMHAKLPGVASTFGYSIHLCAGILTWGLFAEITTRSQGMFLENANLLKKLNFPRLCLPVTIVAIGLLNFAIVFGLFTSFLIVTGNFPGLVYVCLVPLIALLVVFGASLGLILGVLNVFFRDVGQLFSIVITFWFWLTPIVYPVSILPERVKDIIALNPMVNLIEAVQGVLVLGEWPQFRGLLYLATLAIVLSAFGLRLFRSRVGEMVDEL
ncbi:ABC transporter permease [Rhizobium sp. Root1220]|uniref:ABC transporter permease n=1 Tax=Rhizobium sp. Root1220 TaxID=1736432 RepID=UPI0006F38540|nr:ABC transporter permease [Rhizobium sp. Root1220]KQV83984.1 ABC transporter [Rhizobium sp. Root1220]